MQTLPKKTSLVAQSAAAILQEIESGRWSRWLPGEHALCAQLQVSRTTIRHALQQLACAGAIRCQRGQRREIISARIAPRKAKSNRVVLLLPEPSQSMLTRAFLIDHLRERLAQESCVLEMHASKIPFRARRPNELEKLATMLHPAGWVLMGSTQMMQQWFSDRRLPCVIAGSRHPGIELPSVDVDYGAICRHAVGQFISRGHRRIALLNPTSVAAGEILTEAVFRQAVGEAKQRGIEASVTKHDGTRENICSQLDRLMARNPPPTAWLVSRARHALTVLCHLLRRGVRVPEDVAILSRDDEPYLEDVTPTLARYANNPTLFAAKLSRAVAAMIQGSRQIVDHKIMARFTAGQTLG